MFKNKKEHFIFILMICTTMVYIMTCYNVALIEGFSSKVFLHGLFGFPVAFVFALIGDIFIIGKIVGKIAPKFIKENDSMAKRGILMSFFTCCGMVLWMSAFGVVHNMGFGPHFFAAYGVGIVRNVIVAMPLNLLIVSPLVRAIFFKMFPPEFNKSESVA